MFPMNQNAQDLMMNAPSEVNPRSIERIKFSFKKKKIIYFLPFKLIFTSERSTRFFL